MSILFRRNKFYAYYRDGNGKRCMRALGTSDPVLAQSMHDDLMAIVRAERARRKLFAGFNQYTMGKTPAEIGQLVKKTIEESRPGVRLDSMIAMAAESRPIGESARSSFLRFVDWAKKKGVEYAVDVTPGMALDYLEQFYGNASGKSFNNNLSALNVIFRQCLVKAGMSASPFASIPNRLVRNVEHHRALTADEFRRAFETCLEPYKTASLISWHTALRLETCFRLSWSNINEEDKSITIMPGKTARFGRAVYIPIHPELWNHLVEISRPDDPESPILSQWKVPSHYPGYQGYRYYTGLLRSLGINDSPEGKASFHSLRCSFITRMDEAGISRTATKGIAGHVTDNMTDLYSHDKTTAKQILSLPGVLV